MDIMKFLEEDEDDTMHSGADVEAFTAALNRDIEGDSTSASQPTESDGGGGSGGLPPGSNSTSDQLSSQWQNFNQEENVSSHIKQEEPNTSQPQEHPSGTEFAQHESSSESQLQQLGSSQEGSQLSMQQKDNQLQQQAEHNTLQFSQSGGIQMSEDSEQNKANLSEQDRMRNPDNQKQYPNIQKMNTQQSSTTEPSNNPMARSKQVPFGLLLPVIIPHLDKDRAMQLQTLYSKLRRNEINKDGFVRVMRNIVGDQMLRQAVNKIQVQQAKDQAAPNSQSGQQQLQLKGHRPPTDPVDPTVQVRTESSLSTTKHNAQNYRDMEHLSGSQGMLVNPVSSSNMSMGSQERDLSTIPSQGVDKQQHLNLPQSSYPMYSATMSNFQSHTYSGPSMSSSTSFKSQTQDSQIRQAPFHQGMVSTHTGGTSQPMNMMSMNKYEMQNSSNVPKRIHGGPLSHLTPHLMLQHNPASWQSSVNKEQKGSSGPSISYVKQEIVDHTQQQQHKSQFPTSSSSSYYNSGQADQGNPAGRNTVSASLGTPSEPTHTQVPSTTTSLPGTNSKTPPKKPFVGQKKPLDMQGNPPSSASNKKQKVAGAFSDQSIEQLNDVTAVSGVNLREEEEQLLSGPKEENRASEASRRAVQEEEERLILQKGPLQRKLAEIMAKSGIKNMSSDVDCCLSLCVEERLHRVISNLIRVSKQRVDIEKTRHRTLITSDVRRQLLAMNRKAREDWDKKQAEEAEKVRKLNEVDGNTTTDGEKDKDEGRTKNLKVNKEEDDKTRTTAANVAARVAVGGDDMLSKWQLMAEQARQKREGGTDMASAGQSGKDAGHRASSSGRSTRDNQDAENRGPSTFAASGIARKFGKNSGMPHTKIARSISVKDVISVLEREPQMCKSTFLYRLYERLPSGADAAAE